MLNRRPYVPQISNLQPGYSSLYLENSLPTDLDAVGKTFRIINTTTQVTYAKHYASLVLPYTVVTGIPASASDNYSIEFGIYDTMNDDPALLNTGYDINFTKAIPYTYLSDIKVAGVTLEAEPSAIVGVSPSRWRIDLTTVTAVREGQMLPPFVRIEYLPQSSTNWNTAKVLYEGVYSTSIVQMAPVYGTYKVRAIGLAKYPDGTVDPQVLGITALENVLSGPVATNPSVPDALTKAIYRILDNSETFELKLGWNWQGDVNSLRTFIVQSKKASDADWTKAVSHSAGTDTTLTIPNVPHSIAMSYRVKAVGWSGRESNWSTWANITIDPADPSIITTQANTSVRLDYTGLYGYNQGQQTFGLYANNGNFSLGKVSAGGYPLFFDAPTNTLSIDGRTITKQIYGADFIMYDAPGATANSTIPAKIRTEWTKAFGDDGFYLGAPASNPTQVQLSLKNNKQFITFDGTDLRISARVTVVDPDTNDETTLDEALGTIYHTTAFDPTLINNANTFTWTEITQGTWSPASTTSKAVVSIMKGQGEALGTATITATLNKVSEVITIASSVSSPNVVVALSNNGTATPTILVKWVEAGKDLYSTYLNFSALQSGTAGKDSTYYYIRPVSGTSLKEGIGSLEIESWKVEGSTQTQLNGGNIKLYWPNETVGQYKKTFTSTEVKDSLVVTLEDRSGANPIRYDSVTLTDIRNGSSAVFSTFAWKPITGSVNSYAWVKAPNGGAWSPAETKSSFTITFSKGSQKVAVADIVVTRDSAGNLTKTLTQPTAPVAGYTIEDNSSGSGTPTLTISLVLKEGTSVVSTWEESFLTTKGGDKGSGGAVIVTAEGQTISLNPNTGAYTPDEIQVTAAIYNASQTNAVWTTNPVVPTTTVAANYPVIPIFIAGNLIKVNNSVFKDAAFNGKPHIISVTGTITDDSGFLVKDTISITEIVEGTDNLYGFLTNETYTAAADDQGNNPDLSGASGVFRVLRGSANVMSSTVFSIASAPAGVTASINASTGAYSVSAITDSSITTASILLRAVYTDPVLGNVAELTRSFTVSKVIGGQSGAPGAPGNYVDYRFARADTPPAAVGNDPAGWQDSPPNSNLDKPLWMIKGTKSGATGNLIGSWSTPTRIDGTDGSSIEIQWAVASTGPWHVSYAPGDKWMRQKLTSETTWGPAIKAIGEDGSDAVLLRLISTGQTFAVAQSGTVTPGSITLTALTQNVTNAVTWTTSPPVTLTGTGSSRTLTYANMGSNEGVTITISDGSLQDSISIIKVREGKDGVTGLLSNESHIVSVGSDGVIPTNGLAGAGGTFRVFAGGVDHTGNTSLVSYAKVSEDGITGAINTAGVYTLSNMTKDTASVTFRATLSGYPSIDRVYTIAKSKEGQVGDSAVTGVLSNESVSVPSDYNGSNPQMSGATGTFRVFKGVTDVTSQYTFSLVNAVGLTGASINTAGTYVVTGMTADTGRATYRATSGTTVIDKVFTVSKAKAGVPGGPGSNGTPGAGFYTRGYSDADWNARIQLVSGSIPSGSTSSFNDNEFRAASGRSPVNLDVYTRYRAADPAVSSETLMFNGSTWSLAAFAVHGNMIVKGTVRAEQLAVDAALINKAGVKWIVNSAAFDINNPVKPTNYAMLIDLEAGIIHIK